MNYLLEAGAPLETSRGEHGAGEWLETRRGSLSFGSAETANAYAMEPNDIRDTPQAPRVLRVNILMAMPFQTGEDPFFDLAEYKKHFGEEDAIRVAVKFADYITNTSNWEEILEGCGREISVAELLAESPERVDELYFELYPLLDDQDEVDRLIEKGFDGAWCGGSGLNSAETEYRVFERIQVVPTCASSAEKQARADAYQAIRCGEGEAKLLCIYETQQVQPEAWREQLITDMLDSRAMCSIRSAIEMLPHGSMHALALILEAKAADEPASKHAATLDVEALQFSLG